MYTTVIPDATAISRNWWVGLPWVSILGFLRIVTSPRLFDRPLPVAIASRHIRDWLSAPEIEILAPGEIDSRGSPGCVGSIR
jgi:hypothetical protein